jgi:hypothetical protein
VKAFVLLVEDEEESGEAAHAAVLVERGSLLGQKVRLGVLLLDLFLDFTAKKMYPVMVSCLLCISVEIFMGIKGKRANEMWRK